MSKKKFSLTIIAFLFFVLLSGISTDTTASDFTDGDPASETLDGCVNTPGANKGHCQPTVSGRYACIKPRLLERIDCSR